MKVKDDRWCFACGRENPHGLHLSGFREEGEDYVCDFTPERHHQGWAAITHGGIVSTLLDEMMTRAIWTRGTDVVTAEMTVRFRQPVPTGTPLQLRARIVAARGRLITARAEVLLSDGTTAAESDGKFIVAKE
jgi:uncharacterized protein (TIGR00369 family)